jgi:hypothetical protein
MKKTLTFPISIKAPRQLVYDTMLDPEGYKIWTAAFMEGSYFKGSWAKGNKIQFLAGNSGMTAEIAENRPYEFVSIRHLGEIIDGVEDTTSDKVRAWVPAHENYTFADKDGGTELIVTLDTVAEYEQYMLDTYPRALEVLKALCERKAAGAA